MDNSTRNNSPGRLSLKVSIGVEFPGENDRIHIQSRWHEIHQVYVQLQFGDSEEDFEVSQVFTCNEKHYLWLEFNPHKAAEFDEPPVFLVAATSRDELKVATQSEFEQFVSTPRLEQDRRLEFEKIERLLGPLPSWEDLRNSKNIHHR